MRRVPGFTLIELLVVMAIIATLLTIAVPRYNGSVDRAKEATLRQSLATMRDAIDKHFGDTGRYPETLEDLATKKYIRAVPADPITGNKESWVIVPPPEGQGAGVFDLRSGAPGTGSDGTEYAKW